MSCLIGQLSRLAQWAVMLSCMVSSQAYGSDLAKKMDVFVDGLEASPLAPPSYSLAITTSDQILYSRLKGSQKFGEEAALTLDSRLYVASVSKSFLGLLAARLDAEGVIPLGASLADMWPSLKLPDQFDPESITMTDLLSHTAGILNDPLTYRTAYVGGTGTDKYEQILEQFSEPIGRGFSYDNIGYLIYAAILAQQTGRTWRSWLDSYIHAPLNLRGAATSSSEIDPVSLAVGSHLAPLTRSGWQPAGAKPDELMHPAGGHFLSTGAAVKWLQAQLKHQEFGGAVYNVAHQPYAQHIPLRRYSDMRCGGYGLGWHTCDYQGRKVMYHGGTYDGMMIFMVFLPDDDLVVSSINGARSFGWVFGWHSVLQAIDYALSLDGADENAQRRLNDWLARMQRSLNNRVRAREEILLEAASPAADDMRLRLTGSYKSDAYGAASICEENGRLLFKTGLYEAEVLPGADDRLYLLERAYGRPQKLEVTLPDGPSFIWQGGTFARIDAKGCVGKEGQDR